MCGIVILRGPKVTPADCNDLLYAQRHRGRDATSILTLGDLHIGFNRLSINDKSNAGNQPFESENYFGVFNCEIYNSDFLRDQFILQTKGESDAEVILPIFEQVGDKIIDLLDGFYSGVIISKVSPEILFIRDYIGKKPLFCGQAESFMFISSELKEIRGISSFSMVPKGISRLKQHHTELIRSHHLANNSSGDLREALISAVRKRIPKKERQFGIFLSGGLDSSIIAMIANSITDNAIYYCLGDQDGEDASFVRILGKALQIEDKIKYISLPRKDEIPALLEKIIYHTESYNPSIVSNGLATYLLAHAAKKDGLEVVLSGEGADELFCGYRISGDKDSWFSKRRLLIENLQSTELRRVDLSAMAATIEVRCPFLDREVYRISQSLGIESLIDNSQGLQGKKILRQKFRNDLPDAIIERRKMSCDVGSGIRKLVVQYSKANLLGERQNLSRIWSKYFSEKLKPHDYFSIYPVFDLYIDRRGETHGKKPLLDLVQGLVREHYQSIPFHNLFMLNGKEILGSQFGGTCSDKTIYFRKTLESYGIQSFLHTAYINGNECHRLLSINLDSTKYFIDVGSGWPCLKPFPEDREISFSVFGIQFQSLVMDTGLKINMNTGNGEKELMFIPFESHSESEILAAIANRFALENVYPFSNSLRFSILKRDEFLFIKGDSMRVFRNGTAFSESQIPNAQIMAQVEKHSPHLLSEMKEWIAKKQN